MLALCFGEGIQCPFDIHIIRIHTRGHEWYCSFLLWQSAFKRAVLVFFWDSQTGFLTNNTYYYCTTAVDSLRIVEQWNNKKAFKLLLAKKKWNNTSSVRLESRIIRTRYLQYSRMKMTVSKVKSGFEPKIALKFFAFNTLRFHQLCVQLFKAVRQVSSNSNVRGKYTSIQRFPSPNRIDWALSPRRSLANGGTRGARRALPFMGTSKFLSSPDQKSFRASTTPTNRGRKRWSWGSTPPRTVWIPRSHWLIAD